jgi:hypothetical protein
VCSVDGAADVAVSAAVLNSEKLGTDWLSVMNTTVDDELLPLLPYCMAWTGTVWVSWVLWVVVLICAAGVALAGLPREEASGAEAVSLSGVLDWLAGTGVVRTAPYCLG